MNPLDTGQLREEILRWIFSIFNAVIVYLVIACFVISVYHPDVDLLKNTAKNVFNEWTGVRPEPVETMLFRLGVIIIIPAILGFYKLFSGLPLIRTLAKKPGYLVIIVCCIAGIIALTWFDFTAVDPYGPLGGDVAQNNRDKISNTNFDFYFSGIFLGSYLWLYAAVIVPLIAFLYLFCLKKEKWANNKTLRIVIAALGYTMLAWGIVTAIAINTYEFPYSNECKYDFGVVYYSMTQVYSGLPMLVDHFTNTYGLYPHFLNLIFHFTGLSIFKFSLCMSMLTALSFLLNFYVLKFFVRDKLILFLGFSTVLFYPYIDFLITTAYDSLFSCYSIRYIIPSTITCLATLYLKDPSGAKYWITSFIAAFFILWNPEMGLVCYLSWTIVNMYNDFFAPDGTVAKRKILLHLLYSVIVVITACAAYEVLIFLFYHAWPDLGSLFQTMAFFGKLGLGLLPMALIHPWNLMALILIIGFTYAMVQWYRRKINIRSSIILLVSLIALGYFVYYQGRSQNSNFSYSSGFCLILLTLLGDELWQAVKNTRDLFLNSLFVIFLFFISFSFVEIIFNTNKIVSLFYQEEDKNSQADPQRYVEKNIDFMINSSEEHEKILVITQRKDQSLFYSGTKRLSAFNPGLSDLFLRSDVSRLENILLDSSFKFFTEPYSNARYPFLERSLAIVAGMYQFYAANESMVLYKKRQNKIPVQPFFRKADKPAFYRKYTDEKASLALRINDEMGVDSVTINPVFSVQICFYATPQFYPKSTLIGSIRDTCGFAIGNVIGSPKYYFGINKMGNKVTVDYYRWVYFAMNVYEDHVAVYKNGELAMSNPLDKPMCPSGSKLFIGNLGSYQYFIGPIAEVAINNSVIDSNQIRATWEDIRKAVGQ